MVWRGDEVKQQWMVDPARICILKLLGQNWINACHLKRFKNSFHLISPCLGTNTLKHFRSLSNLCSSKCNKAYAPSRTTESRYCTWWICRNRFHWSQLGPYGYKYLLIFVNAVLGFSIQMEMVEVVDKKFVMEIIPRFSLLLSLGYNNSPAFMANSLSLLR